jgi:hypothetical protein
MRYKIAETSKDMAEIGVLLIREGFANQEMVFPTVMAWDGDEVVGFIATTPNPDMVVAGPMVMRSGKRRVFTALRLIELYEQVMGTLGMKSIIFSAHETDSFIAQGIKKWFPQMQPYAKNGQWLYYTWKLGKLVRSA